MSLCKVIIAALAIQLVVAQDNYPGLRLSTGLGALLGDVPLSTSLPNLPPLPSTDSCGAPDLALPPLPPLASGDCLPTFPLSPCESALPPLPVPYKESCLFKRALGRKRRCGCKEPLLTGLPFAPLLPHPILESPYFPSPLFEPYPLLRPKGGCLGACKNKQTSCLLEKLVLKKGLTLGLGPDCGPDIGLLPDAVSNFALDALARTLAGGLDDCGWL